MAVGSLGLHGHLVPHPRYLPRQPLLQTFCGGRHPGPGGVEVSTILQDSRHVAQELRQAAVFASVHPRLNNGKICNFKESQYGNFQMRRSLTHWLLDDLVILGVLPLVHRLHEQLAVAILLDRLERLPDQVMVRSVQLL